MTEEEWTTMFDALESIHRRRILVALLEQNPQPVPVHVPEDVHMSGTDLERLQVEYHHIHLPKLDEEGFINWMRDISEVVKGPNFDEIRPLVELIDENHERLPGGWV